MDHRVCRHARARRSRRLPSNRHRAHQRARPQGRDARASQTLARVCSHSLVAARGEERNSDVISAIHDSPIGPLTLASNGKALIQCEFEGGKYPLPQYELGNDKIIDQARRELDQYFAGKLTTFKVKVDPQGTEFQRKAWAALQTIPYGETRSYAQQAKAIGSPKATRAIGAANGRNPIPVIIPCHRVIGANGSLTGFGGGMERKQILLELEQGGNLLACAS
ncbi:MAG: methylated-DNA--[protein]-cysteine S-methyltransferase [Caulobacteraceae bacterium]|nr:methylated-DNA--[protein]-cysteine S-methyltransferase [Caulobacteraceae bacterium]